MVICLEQGADLHMAELMPLPLTVSCSSKIQIGFLVPADWVLPEKGPLNGCVYVSILYHLRDVASYLPKVDDFTYPPAFGTCTVETIDCL